MEMDECRVNNHKGNCESGVNNHYIGSEFWDVTDITNQPRGSFEAGYV